MIPCMRPQAGLSATPDSCPALFVARASATLLLFGLALVTAPANSQDKDASELAQQLSNPVAALISVPIQLNYDSGYGADNSGSRWTLNVQPVIPISISDDWNLISRTIVPLIDQNFAPVPGAKESGLGDIVQSVFFSPKAPTSSGWIWGAGPVVLLPTGGKGFTTNQWAAGPTVVVLRQQNGWTYGALANHLWGIGGNGALPSVDLPDVNATFLQPFVSKIVRPGGTVTLNLESTYDWERSQWSLPVNLSYSQVLKIGSQLVSVSGGARAYLSTPTGGPDWGLRFAVTLLYPK